MYKNTTPINLLIIPNKFPNKNGDESYYDNPLNLNSSLYGIILALRIIAWSVIFLSLAYKNKFTPLGLVRVEVGIFKMSVLIWSIKLLI